MSVQGIPPSTSGSPTLPDLTGFRRYLRDTGWTLDDEDARTSLWKPSEQVEEHNVRIVLPMRETVADYANAVNEALRALAFVERRLPAEIASDIGHGGADTVAVRLTPPTPSGEAPLSLAYESLRALHHLVVGSAAALDFRPLVLPSRRPIRAESYARQVRVSTTSGSFVLMLSLPLFDSAEPSEEHEAQDEALLAVPPQPFGRRVTKRMVAAVQRAQRMADEVNAGRHPLRVFADPAANAANATELAALSALGGPDKELYSMRFALSPLATRDVESLLLDITPGQQRVLAEAADFLRTKQPRSNVTVMGLVVRLFRVAGLGPGEVVIQGQDDDSGAQRRYRVELGESDYNEAMRAHANGLNVVASGDLVVRGTRLSLRRLTSFAVLPGLGDDED